MSANTFSRCRGRAASDRRARSRSRLPCRALLPGLPRSSCCSRRSLFLALERRAQKRVAGADRGAAEPALRGELEALTAGLAKVLDVAEARLLGQHEQDVVGVVRPEEAGVPLEARAIAAHARFDRPRHDLRQRRIARHRIRQLAGILGIGAAQFDRRRGAAAFAVARIERRLGREINGHTGRGIEAAVSVRAVERAGLHFSAGSSLSRRCRRTAGTGRACCWHRDRWRDGSVASGGERRAFSRAWLIDGFLERFLVDVAVERVRAQIAVIGVRRQ
jgi:hypothetical protein